MSGFRNAGTILGVVNTVAIGGTLYYVSSVRSEMLQKIDTFGEKLKVLLPSLENFANERQALINSVVTSENRVVNIQRNALTEFENKLASQSKQIEDLKRDNNELREQIAYLTKHLVSRGMKAPNNNSGGTMAPTGATRKPTKRKPTKKDTDTETSDSDSD